MPSRTRARLAVAALAIAGLLAAAAATAWAQRQALARWWTLRELARVGVTPAEVEVARFDTRRLELRALRAGEGGALAIDTIDADYTLAGLWRGRLAGLRLAGIRLVGEIGEAGPRFGGLEALAGGEGEVAQAPGLRLPALPSSQLVIEDARAEIATVNGPLAVTLGVNASEADGRGQVRADLVAKHALAQATAQIEVSGEGETMNGAAAVGMLLEPGAGLELPLSAGSLALAAQLEAKGPEILVSIAPGPFGLTVGKGKDALRLEGVTPQAKLRTRLLEEGALAPLEIETTGGDLRAPTLDLAARGLDLDAKLDVGARRLSGRLVLRELLDTRKPKRAPGFAVDARFEPREAAQGFDLRLAELKGRASLRAQGSYDPERGSGEARLRLEPLLFAEKGLQPVQLLPWLGKRLTAVKGALEATGRVRFGGKGIRLTLDLAARDLGFQTPLAEVAGVNGAVRVEGPSPFSTPPAQLVSIGRIGFGLDLVNGLLKGQLRPDGVIVIDQAEWQTLGGRVHTAGHLDPAAPQQAIALEAEDLDLAQLLAMVNLEGLSGEGRLDGRLPIERSAEAILIVGGRIAARPGGWLRYRPAPGVAGLAKSGAGMDLLLGAFENLQYEKLEVLLDGDANGPMQLSLHVVGVNPEFQDGRPIHYNLNVEARLADLLRQGKAVYEIPQVIEERLQRFGQERTE
jgi:hypothetical protein